MEMVKKMEDLIALGLIEDSQERVFPVPDPDNYVDVPLVTFYDMPEPPDFFENL